MSSPAIRIDPKPESSTPLVPITSVGPPVVVPVTFPHGVAVGIAVPGVVVAVGVPGVAVGVGVPGVVIAVGVHGVTVAVGVPIVRVGVGVIGAGDEPAVVQSSSSSTSMMSPCRSWAGMAFRLTLMGTKLPDPVAWQMLTFDSLS